MGVRTACLQWMKQRTSLEKTLMSISVILLVTCILLILIGFVYSTKETEESFCMSTECYQTTGEMLSMMDLSVSPCEDFYDYACGKFVKTHSAPLERHEKSVEQSASESLLLHIKHWLELPPDNNHMNVFTKARTLYSSCMNYGDRERNANSLVLSLIKGYMNGEWPDFDAVLDSEEELQKRLPKFLSSLISLDISVAFKLDIVPDSSNHNKYIAKISPGSPLLLHHEKHDLKNDSVLYSYLFATLTLLGVKESALKKNIESLLDNENRFFAFKEIADKECGHQDRVGDDLVTKRVNFTQLDNVMQTNMQWISMLEDVFRALDTPVVSTVDVYCRRHIRTYIQHFYDINMHQAYNYLAMRFFLTFISDLGPSFHKMHLNYMAHYSSTQLALPFQVRWKECVALLEKYMLPVIAVAYAQDFPMEVQRKGKAIASSIQSSLQSLLQSWSWIEERERKRIKQKISKVEFEVSLLKYAQNISQLENLFSTLNVTEEPLIINVMKLQRFIIASRIQKTVLPKTPDVEWPNLYLTSPEHYQHHEGRLSIHFDKMMPPFLNPRLPGFLNYGSFGFFLSREAVHYAFFSDLGEKLSSCLSNQYSHYDIEEIRIKVDGSETLKENFVDNLAHLIAYKAYERCNENNGGDENLPGFDHSEYQTFFVSFAQAFCEVRDIDGYRIYANSTFAPKKVRVNAVLRNSPKFSEVYSCAVGSPMNPSQKCVF